VKAGGGWPILGATIDGVAVGTFTVDTSYPSFFEFNWTFKNAGRHMVSFTFLNDYADGNARQVREAILYRLIVYVD
jgi:hypothetical protein